METKLYIGRYKVELAEDMPILYSYTVTDYSNPTVVKNGHSKTVTIQGTPNNNKIFGHYWNVQRTVVDYGGNAGIYFNASKKAPFKVFVGGEVYESGYVRLEKVNTINNDITYDITLYSGLGDFFHNLSTNAADGGKLRLCDLNYYTGGSDELDFTINKDTVYEAWEALRNGTEGKWQHINFMPAYNGIPDDFDADKVIINLSGTSLPQSDESGFFRPTSGCVIADLPEEMTEWEMRDLRSYLQRPCVRMKSIIDACCDPNQNGGYRVNLDSDFFDDANPYYSKTWLSLPTLPALEYASEEQILEGAELIGVTTTGDVGTYMYQDLKFDIGEYGSSTPSSINIGSRVFVNNIISDLDVKINPLFDLLLKDINTPSTSYAWFWRNKGDSYHTGWWCLGSLFVQVIALNGEAVVGASDAYNLSTPIRHNGKLYYGHNGNYPDEYKFKPYMDKNIYTILGDFQKDGFHREGSNTPVDLMFNISNINSPVSQLKVVYWWGATEDKVKHFGRTTLFGKTESSSWIDIGGPDADDYGGYYTISSAYPITVGVTSTNLKAVLGSTLGRTGTKITKELLLKTEGSVCDYLLSYAKMFGLYFVKDTNENEISILTRKSFYRRDDIVNLNELIDRGKDIKINPLTFSAKWYKLQQESDEGDWYEKYKAARGIEYGCKILNTGYEFNTDTSKLLEDNMIKSGIEGLEKSKFFSAFNNDNVQRSWMGMGLHYNLFLGDESREVNVPVRNNNDLFGINEGEGMKYYDVFPKLQFHDDDMGKTDGNNVLVFFSGFKDMVGGRSNPLSYYLSDDNRFQTIFNDGTPCWLFTPTESVGGVPVAKKVRYLPVFERYYTDMNSGNVKKSLDFGTPQEIYIPDYNLKEEANIYWNFWRTYLTDLFDVDNKVMECWVKVSGKIGDEWLRRFYWFDNAIWRLNKVTDWKIGTYDTTQMEFVKVKDVSNYNSISQTGGTTIILTADKYRIGYEGGQVILNVSIDTGGDWILTASEGVVLSRTTGTGSGNISATIPANNEGYVKGWYFTVSSLDGATSRVTVSQGYEGEKDFIPVPEDLIIPASGGSVFVDFIWTNQGDDYVYLSDHNEGEDYLQYYCDLRTYRDQNKALLTFDPNTGTTTLHNYCQFENTDGMLHHSIGIDQLPARYEFSESGGSEEFTLFYSADSEFSNVPEWVTIEPNGTGVWRVSAKNNPYSSANEAEITVTNAQGSTASFTVAQTAGEGGGSGSIEEGVSPLNLYYSAVDTTTKFVTITLNRGWWITSPSGTFFTVTQDTGDVGVSVVGVTVDENTGGTRTAILRVNTDTGYTDVTITQMGVGVSEAITTNPSATTVPATGISTSVTITYIGRNGYVINPVLSDSGMTCTPISWTGETGTTTVTIPENFTTSSQTYTITFNGRQASGNTVFTQEAGTEWFKSGGDIDEDYNGGITSIPYTANTSWTATTSDNWIAVAPTSGTGGVSALNITVSVNEDFSARTGYVYVHSIETGNLLRTIPVRQDGKTEILEVAPAILRYDDLGGVLTISITSNTSWIISEYDSSWAPAVVSPSSVTINATGDSTSINIECGGSWELVTPDWLTASSNSGSGNTVVTLTSSPNTGETKSGLITVNDTVVSVEQNGGYEYPPETYPLTLEFLENGTLTREVNPSLASNTSVGEYKLNDGEWTTFGTTTQSAVLNVNEGDVVQLRSSDGVRTYRHFVCSNRFNVKGNPLSLFYGSGFTGQTSLSESALATYLLSGNTGLISAEKMFVPDAYFGRWLNGCTNLVTPPATFPSSLQYGRYDYFFSGCTSLVSAPALPATALTAGCYYSMFQGCTSLTTAPALPATALAENCYNSMFYGCTSLTTAPDLPATTLIRRCYYEMFSGCTNLNYIKCLAVENININGSGNVAQTIYGWVNGVSSTGVFVKNPATTWYSGEYPSGWSIINDE